MVKAVLLCLSTTSSVLIHPPVGLYAHTSSFIQGFNASMLCSGYCCLDLQWWVSAPPPVGWCAVLVKSRCIWMKRALSEVAAKGMVPAAAPGACSAVLLLMPHADLVNAGAGTPSFTPLVKQMMMLLG